MLVSLATRHRTKVGISSAAVTPPDPLAPLMELPGVAAASDEAREALGRVHRHRANRRGWPANAAESMVRGARASSVLDGGALSIAVDGDPGPVLAGALR